jgi:hypothetical protein
MNRLNRPLNRLSPEWWDAIRANSMSIAPEPPRTREKRDRPGCDPPGGYAHSAELRTLTDGLRRERIRRGMSLGDVARASDQARSALSRLENGRYPNPTFDTVYRYALALGMRIALTARPLAAGSGRTGAGCEIGPRRGGDGEPPL